MSPTQRTLAWLREQGRTAEVVERWNPHARVRQDFRGFIDLIELGEGETIGWQATSDNGGNVSARVKKIQSHPNLAGVLAAGWQVYVIGWRKVKVKRGGKSVKWEPRIVEVTESRPC